MRVRVRVCMSVTGEREGSVRERGREREEREGGEREGRKEERMG